MKKKRDVSETNDEQKKEVTNPKQRQLKQGR